MILMDEMIPMKLYSSKQRAYLPFNPVNKKKGALVTLLTQDIRQSIDLINTPFFHNPSYFTCYYQDRNVNRYITTNNTIEMEVEEEEDNELNEAVLYKSPKDSPIVDAFGSTHDNKILKENFTKKKFDKWYDYFRIHTGRRVYPHVYGFNSLNAMFKAIGPDMIEKHGEVMANSYNTATEIFVINPSEYDILKLNEGPYDMYCEAAIITYVIHVSFKKATWKLANNMATHLSGQAKWIYEHNNYKEDDRIGIAKLIGKYEDKYGPVGMIRLARSGDYYLLIQFGAKGFIDRIAKAAKQENALLEYATVFPITELADIPDNKIIVGTDYHFIGYNDDKSKIIVKPKSYTDKIIKMQNDLTGDDGVFIFLGDLFFRSFRTEFEIPGEMKEEGIKLAKRLKGKYKILIRGNHDNLPDEFYIDKCRFTHVCSSVVYNNILFTHQPELVNPPMINVHGHIHGARQYLEKEPHSHMDVWTMNSCHTGTLPDILDKQKEYDKTTKQIKDPSKGDPYQYIPGQRLELDAIINESALLESDGTHFDVVRLYKSMDKADRDFISRDFQSWAVGKDCIYRHVEKEGLLGVYGFIECYVDLYNSASIVIGVDPRRRGEGIASKMMKQMLTEFPKENPDITDLIWRADAKNKKSQKLAEKFGFKLIRKSNIQYVYRKWLKEEDKDFSCIPDTVIDEESLVKWMRKSFELDKSLLSDKYKIRPMKEIVRSKKINNFESGLIIYTALKKMGLLANIALFFDLGKNPTRFGDVYPMVIHTYSGFDDKVLIVDPFDKEVDTGIVSLSNGSQYYDYAKILHDRGRWGDVKQFPYYISYGPYDEDLKLGNKVWGDVIRTNEINMNYIESALLEGNIDIPKTINNKMPMSLDRFKMIPIDDEVIKKYTYYIDGLEDVGTTNNCHGFLWVDPDNELRVAKLKTPVCFYSVKSKKDDNVEGNEVRWLESININPDYKGRGISRQLLDFVLGHEHITNVAVDKYDDQAIRLYRSKGFKQYNINGDKVNMQIDIQKESVTIPSEASMVLENQMYVFTEELSQNAYNSKLRNYLYKDRMRSSSAQIAIFNTVKDACPMIKKAYINPEMYKGLNCFLDLSYYNGLFLNNNQTVRDIAIKFYWNYLNRMLENTNDYFKNNYSKNTIFVPVNRNAWNVVPDTYVYDWKSNLNPISLIFRMIRKNPIELMERWKKYNFIFVGKTGYFRVDFSTFQLKNLVRFKTNLEKLWRNEIIEEDDDVDGYGKSRGFTGQIPDESSSAAITAQVVDRIEKSSGIEINDISAAVKGSKQKFSDTVNDGSIVDTIIDMKISNKPIDVPDTNIGIAIISPGDASMVDTIKDLSNILNSKEFTALISR